MVSDCDRESFSGLGTCPPPATLVASAEARVLELGPGRCRAGCGGRGSESGSGRGRNVHCNTADGADRDSGRGELGWTGREVANTVWEGFRQHVEQSTSTSTSREGSPLSSGLTAQVVQCAVPDHSTR